MPGNVPVSWRLLGAAAALAATAACAESRLEPWTRGSTPSLVLPDLAGRVVDLKRMQGRVVLVNFWATWCEPCRDEMPSLERLRTRLRGRPFEILAVNFGESGARIAEFARKQGLTLHVLLDPDQKASGDWNAKGLPMTFLVDARGQVRYWTFGERDWAKGEALHAVERLVAEVPVARH